MLILFCVKQCLSLISLVIGIMGQVYLSGTNTGTSGEDEGRK